MRPYDFVLCPNQLNVKESFQKKRQGPKDDIFVTSSDNNNKLLQIMEAREAEAAKFVHHNCYVGDGLMSRPTAKEEIDLLKDILILMLATAI